MKIIRSGSKPLDLYAEIETISLYRSDDLKNVYIKYDRKDGSGGEIQWSIDDSNQNASWNSIVIVN